MEIRFLNTDPLYNEYYMQALAFDDGNTWILDNIDQESLFWDIEDMRFSSYTYGLFNNDELVGLSLINFDIDDNNNINYDFSIIINPKYRGQGIGLDFCSQVLETAKKRFKLQSISAHVLNSNIASMQLLSKLGFVNTGCEENINIYNKKFNKVLNKKKAIR